MEQSKTEQAKAMELAYERPPERISMSFEDETTHTVYTLEIHRTDFGYQAWLPYNGYAREHVLQKCAHWPKAIYDPFSGKRMKLSHVDRIARYSFVGRYSEKKQDEWDPIL